MFADAVWVGRWDRLEPLERRALRCALGGALGLTAVLAFDVSLGYLGPYLALSLLASPAPPPLLKAAVQYVFIVGCTCVGTLLLGGYFLSYPALFILLSGLILLYTYYGRGVLAGPWVIWILISLTSVPLAQQLSFQLGTEVARSLTINGAITMLVVWFAHALLPEPPAPSSAVPPAPPPLPPLEVRSRSAIETTLVVLPAFFLFYLCNWLSASLSLIYIALLAAQPNFYRDFRGGKLLLGGTAIGGLVAVVCYELLVMVPELYFLFLLVFLCGLWLCSGQFSGAPFAPYLAKAFPTLVLIIGSESGSFYGSAETKFYTRLWQLAVAALYVVFGFMLVEHFKPRKRK